MSDVFTVKRLLDRMNELGSEYVNMDELARAAASDLMIYARHPIVDIAKEYALHELKALRDNETPLPLGKWYARRRRYA
jgi:hypothetical protein